TTPIGTNADLRKLRDLARQLFRFRAGASLGGEIFAQANRQAFFRRHFSACENDLQGATLADDAGQPHRSPIDQCYAPAGAVDAKVGSVGHYPEFPPQPQFHAAGDSRTLAGCDLRLSQLEPRRSQWATRNFTTVAARPSNWDVKFSQRISCIE